MLTTLLAFSTGVNLLLALIVVGQQWSYHQMTMRWMRLFSAKQDIPPAIMEGKETELPPQLPPKPKGVRISVPIPMGWTKPPLPKPKVE